MGKKTKKGEGLDLSALLRVHVGEPKPNPMFDQFQHDFTRFLLFSQKVKCAVCGKMSKKHWTMLIQFMAMDFEGSIGILKRFPPSLAPLTPVCDDHPIGPDTDLLTATAPKKEKDHGKSAVHPGL